MIIEFLSVAQHELDDAITYYNYEQKGFGRTLSVRSSQSDQTNRTLSQAWQLLTKNSHRCLINHFPYGIIYQIREKKILIIAIANLHRKPNYWQNRIV